jgi:hypothetical protein
VGKTEYPKKGCRAFGEIQTFSLPKILADRKLQVSQYNINADTRN